MTEANITHEPLTFEQSLTAPIAIHDTEGGHRYDVHTFNTHIEARPLLIYLGLGTTAMTSMGQAYLREYTATVEQPILTLQPHTNNWRSLPARAASDIEALNSLGVGELDVAGASAGALIGASVAQQAGDRVAHLATISSVGTRHGYVRNLLKLPQQLHDGLQEAIALRTSPEAEPIFHRASSNFFNPRHYKEMLQLVHWSTNTPLAGVIEGIAPSTKWTDVVGTKDSMSDYQDHLAIVRRRNSVLPHSSSIHLLGHESHMWSTKRALLAQLVRASLR